MVGPPPSTWTIDPALSSAREVARGVWCLRLPLPWHLIPHVNAYAIKRPDGGVTLVDCGGWGDETSWSTLVLALRDAGIAVSDVGAVLLTHYHSDHAGTTGRLVEETGCEVYGHASHQHFTDALLEPGRIAAARARRALREGVPAAELFAYKTVREELEGIVAPVMPERLLEERQQIDGWQVLEAPGHAPSQICLYRACDRVLIGADLFGSAFTPYMDYGYSADPVEEYLQSLAKVGALPIDLLLPGHGRPLEQPFAHVRMWQEGLEREGEAVLAAVLAGRRGGYEIARAVGGPAVADPHQAPWILANVLSHLRHLRLHGRIERVEEEDGSYSYRGR